MDHQAAAELLNEALEDRGIEISAGELLLIMENLDESLGMLEELVPALYRDPSFHRHHA